MKKTIRWLSAGLFALLVPVFVAVGYYSARLPNRYYATQTKDMSISTTLPISLQLEVDKNGTVVRAGEQITQQEEQADGQLKLFGVVPIKKATLQTVQKTQVLLGGEPFGMKLFSAGVMVTGFSDIVTANGKRCPAKEGGLAMGDIILSVNNKEVSSNDDLIAKVEQSGGKQVKLQVKRDSTGMTISVLPVANKEGDWRLGVWVKDSSAGIGTVTFYAPDSGSFGGLGHPICEQETGKIVPLRQGEMVKVIIDSFEKGTASKAGELRGYFSSPLSGGTLWGNTTCGIFGSYLPPMPDKALIRVAAPGEVHTGKAMMYTTISGTTPKGYEIEIEKILLTQGETKNLVLKVTDPTLLSKTGGILQGMSGSPIVQNGKLIGAVTHVYVGDPAHGYGVFAYTMLSELRTLEK